MQKVLEQNRILKHLDKEDIRTLAEVATAKYYKKGDIICKKNQASYGVFMIAAGCVTEYAMDGNEFAIFLKEGGASDCFGELAVLLEEAYYTSVVALSDTSVIIIPKGVFNTVMWHKKRAMKDVLSTCIARLQKSVQRSISHTMFHAEGRLAYIILMLHKERRQDYIRVTQENLSSRCGIARQTASTILNQWKKEHLIEIHRGKLTVLNADALLEIAMHSAKNA